MWKYTIAIACVVLVPPAWGAEDPGARALQQHQLQRQQQQEALHLRMLQQHRVQAAPAGAQQALEQLHSGQRQRQDQEHYRQGIEPATAQPSDDEGTRRAKAEMERQKTQQQSQQHLQRADTGERKGQ